MAEIILDYPAAASLLARHAQALPAPTATERLPVAQALGRVLSADIRADRDQPPFDRSTRDGYALRATDLSMGQPLKVIGQLRAGQAAYPHPLRCGEALEIMTGAPMPRGTDAVLMVEHATVLAGNGLQPKPGRSLLPGDNVVRSGSEAVAGRVIVPAGTRLSPLNIGAAVSCGHATVEVYARPSIAILATGDELVEPGTAIHDHQIRNSNSYSLAAQVERAGGGPIRLPIAHDTLADLDRSLEAATRADLILLSGGVSMGKYDFVEQALTARGAEFLFTGVRIQPGKPVVFGCLPQPAPADAKYFFGLPGNPVSTIVTFALFAGPLIRALGGEKDAQPLFSRAQITEDFKHQPGLTRFLPAFSTSSWDRAGVAPIPWHGSGDLAATARANCFLVIPPDRDHLSAGEQAGILLA
jgi:molybdopterin molybdotransferase